MSKHLGPVDVSSNGTRRAPDMETSSLLAGGASFDETSVEERLDALMQTVHSWDWRVDSLETGAPMDCTPPRASIAAPMPAPTDRDRDAAPVSPNSDPMPDSGIVAQPALEPVPRHARIEPVPVEDHDVPPARTTSWSTPPPPLSLSQAAPEDETDPPHDRPARHARVKLAAFYLAGALAVLLVIGVIRFFG